MDFNVEGFIFTFLTEKLNFSSKKLGDEVYLISEEDRTVDISGKIKSLVVEKLKEVVEQLEEEFGMMFFGKRVRLKGRNIKKDKMVKAEGIVSEVNVYVSEDLEVQLKIKFKDAGKVYEDIKSITVIDTMPSKKRQSNSPLYHT